ncbi:MAG: hypothetical protein Q7U85_06900 [Rhodocyclaceae bacterium]|nr:hypothetical protein [Rhodocyclaceae bacterium]
MNSSSPELTPEDALRLNVLLAGDLLAVRIDEGARVLHGLTGRGEARILLNPVGRAERYFMRVRELLGGHALGSPGGYPVHLRRWTRMGHASPKSLEVLLKLGEPEAVLSVAYAPALTDELARRAWWALPTMEVARVMLAAPAVRAGAMGRELVAYLVEHLPFEEDPVAAMNTVRAVLAAGLIEPAAREQLWRKARRRPHYLVGFLEHMPDSLPDEPPRDWPTELVQDTPALRLLARCFSGAGQAYLQAAELVLEKPLTHETAYLLLNLLGEYFRAGRDVADPDGIPAAADLLAALAALAQLNADVAAPILTRTTAVGPLMRRHLEPLFAPIIENIKILRGVA